MRTAVVYLLIFVLAGFVGNLWMSRNQASGSAPVISAQDLKGNWHNIAQGQFDGPVLLYFFADWCPICKVQHAAIRSTSEHYPVLAIAMQSGDTDNVRQYVEQAELDMPVINDIDGPPTVLECAGAPEGHWLAVHAIGTKSNRSAIGAVIRIETDAGTQARRVRAASSYASHSELTARFGLGAVAKVNRLEVEWPLGRRETFEVSGVDRVITVTEGEGAE